MKILSDIEIAQNKKSPDIVLMKKFQNIGEKNLKHGEKKLDTQWDLDIKV